MALTRWISKLWDDLRFGVRQLVRPLDPATFASVTVLLVIGAVLSVAGPAWRAARIDPAVALRDE